MAGVGAGHTFAASESCLEGQLLPGFPPITLSDLVTGPHPQGTGVDLLEIFHDAEHLHEVLKQSSSGVIILYCIYKWYNYKPIPNLRIPESSKRSNV